MKTVKSTIAALMLIAVAGSVRAQSPRVEINPALTYYQAFLVAPDISEADMDYLATNNLWSSTLPPHFGELVGRYDAEFQLVRQGASSTAPCDWGLDLSPGPATLLPHLARVKAVMVGARYRVAWDLQNGHEAQARDDLVAAFTLARNVSRDGTLISVLVQVAAETIGCSIISENYGKISPQLLQGVVQGIDAAPARGTAAASIAFEKITFHDWLLQKILALKQANPGDETKVMAGIHELMSGLESTESGEPSPEQNLWDATVKAAGNTSDGIIKLLREEDPVYERLATIMALPYSQFDAQAQEFLAELKQSPNPLVAQTLPSCLKVRQREFKVQVRSAMLRAALEYKLNGEPGVLTVNDPCGEGPFAFQRFFFEGVDRGFQLKSRFQGSGFPEILIFVEKSGPPFLLDGPHAGEARLMPKPQK
jgi:hypothetical protein